MDHIPANLYRELGVKPGVSAQQLRQAYRKSVMRYHPDTARGGGNTEKFRQVTEAYKLLQKMTIEMHRSSKTSTVRTFDLKQKFASVFQKKKIKNTTKNKKFYKDTVFSTSSNEKIKVNQQTSKLSLNELINCVEHSENEYVRQVAMEAIASRKEDSGIRYLINLLQKSDLSMKTHLIDVLGMTELSKVSEHLYPLILDSSIEIAASAIKALERIDGSNRKDIIEFLRNNSNDSQKKISGNLSNLKKRLFSIKSSKRLIGKMLVRSKKITEDQLEIGLLIQKRIPLLLGQILRYLDYVSILEIKNLIASQKKLS